MKGIVKQKLIFYLLSFLTNYAKIIYILNKGE